MQQRQPSDFLGILVKCCPMMLHATTPKIGKSVTRMLPGNKCLRGNWYWDFGMVDKESAAIVIV